MSETQTPDVSSKDAWQDLTDEERDQILQERMEDNEEVTDPLSLEEKGSALAKLEAVSQEEWEAEVIIRGHSIPIPCYALDEAQQETVREKIQVIFEAEDLKDQEDIDDVDDIPDDIMGQLEDLDAWLNEFLAEVTVEDEMDQDYWEAGKGIPAGTKYLLFFEVADRMMEEVSQVQSFR